MGAAAAPYMWPAIAMLGSQIAGSVMAPDGQELQTFEGEGNLDPRSMFGEGRDQLNDMIGLLKQRANQPVTLRSSYAQNLPVFTGGGLPMPIGIYGTDPALHDPSLLQSQGNSGLLGAKVDPVPRDRTNPPRGSGEAPNTPAPGDTRFPGEPRSGPYGQPTTEPGMPQRRTIRGNSLLPRQTDIQTDPNGDDLMRGAGAVELLLRSFQP